MIGRKPAQTLRRKSDARTRSRNCFGVSGGGAEGGALAGFDFTAVGAALFAAFFAVVPAARRARCSVAKFFALASTISAGEPSRVIRWSRAPAWDAPGTLLPYAAAIRSSVTSRRML